MRIDVKIADDQLARFQNMAGAVGSVKARQAYARAINRVTNSVYGKVIRATAKQTSIPTAILRKTVRKSLAAHKGDGPLSGAVYATGKPLSLKYFGARQFKWGTRVKVWGETRKLNSAFIFAGTYNSGKAVANGHVWKRVGKSSLPIEKQEGPSVPEGIVAGEAEHAFRETVETMLPARVQHELSRLLGI